MEGWTDSDIKNKSKSELKKKLIELDGLPWSGIQLSKEQRILRNNLANMLDINDAPLSERAIENAVTPELDMKIENCIITTTPSFPNHDIELVIDVITSECVFGMNVFRDFFAGMTDFFGGRSEASQKVLRDARNTCLYELKKEAVELGGDGIVGIDLDYSEISGKGKGMLFLVASGTVVKLKK
jgi:uncharacterized protein YbjQ (UPF0145 family)